MVLGVSGRECGGGSETQALPGSVCRESADRVVLHMGKYEELIVCSHEIAASTAQLVAASKVKLCASWPLASASTLGCARKCA